MNKPMEVINGSRLDFSNDADVQQMLLIKPDSKQQKIISEHQPSFSQSKAKHSSLKRVQAHSAGLDSPRGPGVQLKLCTTPAHIRRDSQAATRYTPPPEGPVMTIVPPCEAESTPNNSICVEDLEDIL